MLKFTINLMILVVYIQTYALTNIYDTFITYNSIRTLKTYYN